MLWPGLSCPKLFILFVYYSKRWRSVKTVTATYNVIIINPLRCCCYYYYKPILTIKYYAVSSEKYGNNFKLNGVASVPGSSVGRSQNFRIRFCSGSTSLKIINTNVITGYRGGDQWQ